MLKKKKNKKKKNNFKFFFKNLKYIDKKQLKFLKIIISFIFLRILFKFYFY